MSFESILEIVQNLETFNPYGLIEMNDIKLIRDSDFIRGNELSRIITYKNHTCIFIKDGLESNHEQYILSHELGHYYLHSFRNTFVSSSRYEYEADMFACLCLIECNLQNYNYDMWLMDFCVPVKAITNFNDALYQYRMKSRYGNAWLRLEC